MAHELESMTKWGDLHQVWFVRDYYQLKFEGDQTISVYNVSEIDIASGKNMSFGEPSFCDALVNCIESKIEIVDYTKRKSLGLSFGNGTLLRIRLDSDSAHGPEAFEIPMDANELACYIEFNE